MTHPYIPGRAEVHPLLQGLQNNQKQKKKTKKEKKERKTTRTDEDPMLIDDEEPDEDRIIKKRKGFSYYPLYTYKRNLDKTFYYKYFKPCSHDYRRLRMEEDCSCSETDPHNTNCEWYDL